MYASIRTYRFGSGSADDLMHRVDRDFADALAQEPGFVAYQVIATGENRIMSISVFRNREDAERSNELAAQWVADDLADFAVERIGAITGEVSVSRAAAAIMEPAHH
jgi:quinol monooxygenase YgiN